jgi:hypothetical protein
MITSGGGRASDQQRAYLLEMGCPGARRGGGGDGRAPVWLTKSSVTFPGPGGGQRIFRPGWGQSHAGERNLRLGHRDLASCSS